MFKKLVLPLSCQFSAYIQINSELTTVLSHLFEMSYGVSDMYCGRRYIWSSQIHLWGAVMEEQGGKASKEMVKPSQRKDKKHNLDRNSSVTVCVKQLLVLSNRFCDGLRCFFCFLCWGYWVKLWLFPWAQDNFPRLNYEYLNFPTKRQVACQLQIHSLW